jgi:uncharacterized protein (DUF488 family)
MKDSMIEVLTIGHSTNSYGDFLSRLRGAQVTAVADVRSLPFSRHFPHFNQKTLEAELKLDKIAYVFLGEELGGRPKDAHFFNDGVADYEKMAQSQSFVRGLERVLEGARKFKIALMCSEHDPLDCHRCLLVGRALATKDISVKHIIGNGSVIENSEVEKRLLGLAGRSGEDFFETLETRLSSAYRERAMRVAFSELKDNANERISA